MSEKQPKGQHFLLSPACRTLTVMDLAKVCEATAYGWFKRMRWLQTDGEPFSPKCGTLRCHSMSRGRFKCSDKACKAVFTVTSGTMPGSFKKGGMAIWLSVNSVKGKAALQPSREIGVQFKTAWVMMMKLREAIAWRREDMVLEGEVEIDGKYAGGHIRPKNKAEDRLKKFQNMKRLCALALRERGLGGRNLHARHPRRGRRCRVGSRPRALPRRCRDRRLEHVSRSTLRRRNPLAAP
ncbi:transposase [Mesorhizobium sp. M0293]|uniref:transposase n=1 Tax=Mesorhizobium sp. M0293 TaxID=2956930 RepID=UPI00333B5DDE